MPRARPATIAARLAEWFPTAAREMSWRRTRDPYAIWVSEVMLQQTRVETVERYYPAFMERFPTVERLADADEESVLSAWSGLGYYRRASLLHRGARHVRDRLGGALPERAEALREVPGIGPYTAGAIASIAFDRPEPLVDGNVARVLSRLDALEDPADQGADARGHWQRAREILEQGSPRVLAQALMELGAIVCTPRGPRCVACPLRRSCLARAGDRQDHIPALRVRKASSRLAYWALLLTWGDRVLLERRPAPGLLARTWCPPLLAQGTATVPTAASISKWIGVPVRLEASDGRRIEHVFSHRVWELAPVVARLLRRPRLRGRPGGEELGWFPGEVGGGIPAVARKLIALASVTPGDA